MVVVGDGAVGLLGVLSAKQMGAERIIAMSRHEKRQQLAREFGATDIVTERGDEGVARIKETDQRALGGLGAGVRWQRGIDDAGDSVDAAGRFYWYVGVPHGMKLDVFPVFFHLVRLHGGPAPVRRYLPDLIELVWDGRSILARFSI